MALNKRERTLLVTTISVLVVGGNLLLISPLLRSWDTINETLKMTRRERSTIQATLDRASGWQQEFEKLRGSVTHTQVKFERTSDVLRKVEELAQASGVVIESERQMPVIEKDVYRELPVQYTVSATTDMLVRFLESLQTGAGFLSVEQLQISPKPDNLAILRCDIQIRALSGKAEKPSS